MLEKKHENLQFPSLQFPKNAGKMRSLKAHMRGHFHIHFMLFLSMYKYCRRVVILGSLVFNYIFYLLKIPKRPLSISIPIFFP